MSKLFKEFLAEEKAKQLFKVKLLTKVDVITTRFSSSDKNAFPETIDAGTVVSITEVSKNEVTFRVNPTKDRNAFYTAARKGFFDNVDFLAS